MQGGVDKDILKSLLTNADFDPMFHGLKLNPELKPSLSETALKRDNYYLETQSYAGAALAYLGAATTALMAPEPGPESEGDKAIDKKQIMKWLAGSAELLTQIFFCQTRARRAYIEPGLQKPVSAVLKECSPVEFLYGPGLGDKLKQAQVMQKLGESLKEKSASTPKNGRKNPGAKKTPGSKFNRKKGSKSNQSSKGRYQSSRKGKGKSASPPAEDKEKKK